MVVKSKSTTSAIVILPPQDVQDRINDLFRQYYDPAYFKGWMPHIKLMYPFFPEEFFETRESPPVQKLLSSDSIATFRPFTLRLESVEFFQTRGRKSKQTTMYLKPIEVATPLPPPPQNTAEATSPSTRSTSSSTPTPTPTPTQTAASTTASTTGDSLFRLQKAINELFPRFASGDRQSLEQQQDKMISHLQQQQQQGRPSEGEAQQIGPLWWSFPLVVGEYFDVEQTEELVRYMRRQWEPIEFLVDSIHIVSKAAPGRRGGDRREGEESTGGEEEEEAEAVSSSSSSSSYQIRHSIPLGWKQQQQGASAASASSTRQAQQQQQQQQPKFSQHDVFRFNEDEMLWTAQRVAQMNRAVTDISTLEQQRIGITFVDARATTDLDEIKNTLETLHHLECSDIIAFASITRPFLIRLLRDPWVQENYFSSESQDGSTLLLRSPDGDASTAPGHLILSKFPFRHLIMHQYADDNKAIITLGEFTFGVGSAQRTRLLVPIVAGGSSSSSDQRVLDAMIQSRLKSSSTTTTTTSQPPPPAAAARGSTGNSSSAADRILCLMLGGGAAMDEETTHTASSSSSSKVDLIQSAPHQWNLQQQQQQEQHTPPSIQQYYLQFTPSPSPPPPPLSSSSSSSDAATATATAATATIHHHHHQPQQQEQHQEEEEEDHAESI